MDDRSDILKIFACPLCKGDIHHTEETYICSKCGKIFNEYKGIIDFRVFGPSGVPDEKIHVEKLIENFDRYSFDEFVRYYIEKLAGTKIPQNLRNKYIEYRFMRHRLRLWTV